jgi:hypothetical protein
MKSLNADGCGVAIGPETSKAWQTVVQSSTVFCETTYALHKLTVALPAVRNIAMRKRAAKEFQTEMEKRSFDMGPSMAEHLAQLVATGEATVSEEQAAGQQQPAEAIM